MTVAVSVADGLAIESWDVGWPLAADGGDPAGGHDRQADRVADPARAAGEGALGDDVGAVGGAHDDPVGHARRNPLISARRSTTVARWAGTVTSKGSTVPLTAGSSSCTWTSTSVSVSPGLNTDDRLGGVDVGRGAHRERPDGGRRAGAHRGGEPLGPALTTVEGLDLLGHDAAAAHAHVGGHLVGLGDDLADLLRPPRCHRAPRCPGTSGDERMPLSVSKERSTVASPGNGLNRAR